MIINPITMLNAVSAATTSEVLDVHEVSNMTFHIIASGVTTSGGTVDIETSLDETNWINISNNAFAANGKIEYTVSQKVYKWVRARVSSYSDGAFTVNMIAHY